EPRYRHSSPTRRSSDLNGNPVGGITTTWMSSNDSIATVDASGLVTAGVWNGPAWIRAEGAGLADSVRVVVRDVAFVLYTEANSRSEEHTSELQSRENLV